MEELFEELPFFAHLGRDGIKALNPTILNKKKRDVLYLPDDASHSIFFLHSGRVRISRLTHDGKSLTLRQISKGEWFGDASLLETDLPSRHEVAEMTETGVISEWPSRAVAKMLQKNPALSFSFLLDAVRKRLALEARVETLVFRDVTSKLAELLIGLEEAHGKHHSQGRLLATKITHQEIANLIGSTRETVSLTLAQFKKRGLVTTEGRRVIIVDKPGLSALA